MLCNFQLKIDMFKFN